MKPMSQISSVAGPPVTAVTPLDVLFVDDERDIGTLMTRFLQRSGYTAESATNGQTALKVLRQRL